MPGLMFPDSDMLGHRSRLPGHHVPDRARGSGAGRLVDARPRGSHRCAALPAQVPRRAGLCHRAHARTRRSQAEGSRSAGRQRATHDHAGQRDRARGVSASSSSTFATASRMPLALWSIPRLARSFMRRITSSTSTRSTAS